MAGKLVFGGWKIALGDCKMVLGNCKMDLLAGNLHFSAPDGAEISIWGPLGEGKGRGKS